MIRSFVTIIAAAVSLTFFVPLVFAQQAPESVLVKLLVVDPSGAPIPGACINIVGKTQDFQLTLAANKSGWLEAILPPGQYHVAAAAQGFSKAIRAVDVGGERDEPVRLKLNVGGCPQCLEVQGLPLTRLEFGPDGLPVAIITTRTSDKSCTGCACYFDGR